MWPARKEVRRGSVVAGVDAAKEEGCRRQAGDGLMTVGDSLMTAGDGLMTVAVSPEVVVLLPEEAAVAKAMMMTEARPSAKVCTEHTICSTSGT